MNHKSAIYTGTLRHRRFKPTGNAFAYSVCLFYLDLAEIPRIGLPAPINHLDTNDVGNLVNDWATNRAWFYDGSNGRLYVNCTHTDTRGVTWSLY